MKAIFLLALLFVSLWAGLTQPAMSASNATNVQARVLIVTGIDYPGHLWRETSPVLAEALSKDSRLAVFTVQDPWFLDTEFAKIAGRVWAGPKVRQHDPFGPFRVEITNRAHPITQGTGDFDTQDELYTCLTGDHPIEVLAQAKSRVDGKYYPMAFISNYGKGRTFHCTLGHDAQALRVPVVQLLFQHACAWAAGIDPTVKPNQ